MIIKNSFKIILLLTLLMSNSVYSECQWVRKISQDYNANQFKRSLDYQSISLHANGLDKEQKNCIESWLNLSEFDLKNKEVHLYAKIQSKHGKKTLILQSSTRGIQIDLNDKNYLHPIAIFFALILLFAINGKSKEYSLNQLIKGLNQLIHLLHNKQSETLYLSKVDLIALKKLNFQVSH
ncbi:hypothetical protein MJH12_17260, partial [bacterium]|nr:hypothetical protein [bacterium]